MYKIYTSLEFEGFLVTLCKYVLHRRAAHPFGLSQVTLSQRETESVAVIISWFLDLLVRIPLNYKLLGAAPFN
jgi:hypothetical protein